MDDRQAQALLADAGYYKGDLDGTEGAHGVGGDVRDQLAPAAKGHLLDLQKRQLVHRHRSPFPHVGALPLAPVAQLVGRAAVGDP